MRNNLIIFNVKKLYRYVFECFYLYKEIYRVSYMKNFQIVAI